MPIQPTVLLVEDDSFTRQFYSLNLKHSGFRILEADSFESALEVLQHERADLALLDFRLGAKSGLDVLSYLRKEHPACPCIMLSASADKQTIIEALRLGAVDFLEKPVDESRLLHVIQHWSTYLFRREQDVRLLDYEAMYQSMMESRNQYQRLVDYSPNIIYSFSNRRGGLFYSKQATKILGYPLAYLYNHPFLWHQSIHPDDKALVDDAIAYKSGNGEFNIEYRIQNSQGEWLWLRDRSISRRVENGEIIIDGAAEDITVRKRIETELKNTDALLSESQRIAHIGSWQLTGDDHVAWTPETYRIFGVPPDFSPTLSKLERIFHPEDRQAVQQWIESCRAGGKPGALEFRIVHPDGEIRNMLAYGDLCNMKESPSGCMVGTVQDITVRRQLEDEMRIAAATFESHEPIIITDASANIVRVNSAFSKVTGYNPEEVIGKNPRIMRSGRHDQEFYAAMWKSIRENGSWSGEIYDKRKDGEIFPKILTITAIRNQQQVTTHYVAIFKDITDRKRMEEEIRELAFYDPLTGLPNRRLLLDRFSKALTASHRNNDFGATLFIDLDNFKALNDTLGHDYGDLLLQEVAKRLKSCVRETDTVSRFGGDEFVVLLEALDNDEQEARNKVTIIGEKIIQSLSSPYWLNGSNHASSPSIGGCLFHDNQVSVERLIERADKAMYKAKKSGGKSINLSLAICTS